MADVDGERARTLFSSSEPILSAGWSPDGRRVAYVSFETGRPSIILQDIDGPSRERLTNFRGINGSPVFSPDGRQLAMVLSRSGDPEVFVMNLETRKLRRITRHPALIRNPLGLQMESTLYLPLTEAVNPRSISWSCRRIS